MSLRLWVGGQLPRLRSAMRNVSRAKIRSGLAGLAIFIGVTSIAVVGAGGEAFKQSQLQNIESQGATYVFVSPGVDNDKGYFTREDLVEIQDTVGTTGVVATTSEEAELRSRGGRSEQLSISYIGSAQMLRAVATIDQGEIPQNWRQEAVVSSDFATEENINVGDRLRVQNQAETGDTTQTYRVAAVLAESNQIGGGDVYLPITRLDEQQYTQIQILTGSASQAEATAELLRSEFNEREDQLLVFELTGLLRLFNQIVTGINTFLLGVGTIAMVIAGVSIANTMLLTVIQRREEIGVLRAVGYQRADILQILLLETLLLGIAGGIAGIAVATPVVMVANQLFLQNAFGFSQTAIGYFVLAFGFGVGISLVAGLYPAWRAANERPVDALRG